ncbi:MAG: hypothetical protein ACRD0Y_09440 [Terriglobales bacterium]
MRLRLQLALALGALALLTASAVLFVRLDRDAELAMRASAVERAESPASGSLVGILSAASHKAPRRVYGIDLDRRSRLLVFVVHAVVAARDAAYWDKVITLLGPPRATGPVFGYWGVCDSGDACTKSAPGRQFTALSHLDLYEMHALALADGSGGSLLYRSGAPSGTWIPRAPTPEAEAKLVLQAALVKPTTAATGARR